MTNLSSLSKAIGFVVIAGLLVLGGWIVDVARQGGTLGTLAETASVLLLLGLGIYQSCACSERNPPCHDLMQYRSRRQLS